MTDTVPFTGKVLDKHRRPVAGLTVIIVPLNGPTRDAAADEVYAATAAAVTDDQGRLMLPGATEPGVPLIGGEQYLIRGTTGGALAEVVFTMPTTGTLDLADVVPEPVDLPTSWRDTIDAIVARIVEIETNSGDGSAGPGDKGPTGDQGPVGDKGPTGDVGAAGAAGPVGSQGPVGEAGTKGDTGDKGPTGDKGLTGDTGTQGATGDKGPTGDKGATGDAGATGSAGSTALVRDEGTALPARSSIDFVGAGVTATDSGTKTVVTIPGGTATDQSFANTFCEATLGNPSQGGSFAQTLPQAAFTKINLPTELADPGGNFNPSTGIYAVPAAGIYLIIMKIRVVDGAPVGVNFGIGVHTSEDDNAAFQWQSTLTAPTTQGPVRRYVVDYQRQSVFAQGDPLRAIGYVDSSTLGISVANFTIKRVA